MTQPTPQALAAAEAICERFNLEDRLKYQPTTIRQEIAQLVDQSTNLLGLLKAAEQAYKHMKENGDSYATIQCRASQDFWAIVCALEAALKLTLNGKAGIGLL